MSFDPRRLTLGRLYTRPELAELWGYKRFEAISKGVVTPAGGGSIILFVTRQKQESLTQYQDFLSGDYLHWEGEKGHRTDDRIAYAHENGEEIHLFYRDIHHTPFRYHGELRIREFARHTSRPSEFRFELLHDMSAQDDLTLHESELVGLPETERLTITKARLGQGVFRELLLTRWGGCAVTDIRVPELLRASHIKPWRSSTNDERVSPDNGLLLLPQYDHLFDRGYITFANSGEMIASPALSALPHDRLGIAPNAKVRSLSASHYPFLDYHRDEVFLCKSA